MEKETHQQETSNVTEQFSRRRFLQGTTAALATSAVVGKSAATSSEKATPELWSAPETWGGSTPSAGDEVTIESGKHVLLDQNTPNLGGVTVHGVLEFKDGAYRELTSESPRSELITSACRVENPARTGRDRPFDSAKEFH